MIAPTRKNIKQHKLLTENWLEKLYKEHEQNIDKEHPPTTTPVKGL